MAGEEMNHRDMDERNIPELSVHDFCEFLSKDFDDEVVESFRRNKISGGNFLKLTEEQLGKIVSAIGDLVELQSLQHRIKKALNPVAEPVSIHHSYCQP